MAQRIGAIALFSAGKKLVFCTSNSNQGDQIGRFFADWAIFSLAIFFFGDLFENCKSSPNSWAIFFHGTSCVLLLTKNGLGYILGGFFSQTHLVTLIRTEK
jgi:hypothetical protein